VIWVSGIKDARLLTGHDGVYALALVGVGGEHEEQHGQKRSGTEMLQVPLKSVSEVTSGESKIAS